MKNKDNPVALASYDDIFNPVDMPNDNEKDRVVEIPLTDLHPFENHPFKVLEDDIMDDTVESIQEFGILVPAIVRPRKAGGYEIISGHRRKRACEILGLETMPVIIRDLDDDDAVITLVDSNLQREKILPSEKAFAFRMRMEAIKRRAGRRTKNQVQLGPNYSGKDSREIIADETGESRSQILRYIRLTELIPDLLSKVDDKMIAFNPAVELSYLRKEEQETLLEVINLIEATPSLSQAQHLKKLSQEIGLKFEMIEAVLAAEKKDADRVVIKGAQLKKYFPNTYTPRQMEDIIITLLENWAKNQKSLSN